MKHAAFSGAIKNNKSNEAVKVKFDEVFAQELISMFRSNFDLYQKLDCNEDLKNYVNKRMFDFVLKKIREDDK